MKDVAPSLELVDFNYLSDAGLIYKINKEILHPVGLALGFDPSTGKSSGAYVAPDGEWEYPDDEIQELEERLNAFYSSIMM
jgi:hypothetical protein